MDPSDAQDMPPPGSTWLEIYQWACENMDTTLLYFDVKYYSLRASGVKELDYAYSAHADNSMRDEAAIYVMVFESLSQYVALVPKHVFENATDFGYGVEPLICGLPPWCLLFLVHVDDLAEAIQGISGAIKSKWYTNPTTGVVFSGWRPRTYSTTQHLMPEQAPKISSMSAVLMLAEGMNANGWKTDFNPVAPLLCDFWIWADHLAHLGGPIFIEHKAVDNYFHTGVDSPFAPDRQWHFVICSKPGVRRMFCCARQDVGANWHQNEQLDKEVYEDLCHDDLSTLLAYIASNAHEAMVKSRRIASPQKQSAERNLDSIISPESRAAAEHSDIHRPLDAHAPKERVFHDKGLPWLSLALNNLFATDGNLVCYPQDPYHPSGADHLVVDHKWTPEDRSNLKLGLLPIAPLLSCGQYPDRKAVAIRFADLSGGFGSSLGHPIVMRRSYHTRPCPDVAGVILLGSILPKEVYQSGGQLQPYVLIRAQQLASYSSPLSRTSVPIPRDKKECESRDEKFFNFASLESTELLPGPFSGSHSKALAKGTSFVQDDFDPLTSIFDMHDLQSILLELLTGEAHEMSIQSRLMNEPTASFVKADNLTTVGKFYQAAWDFSCKSPAS